MAKIRVLPFELANQIAAGEVIERPASVVKELLENAMDANANEIIIEIEAGGINKIKVTDNGDGILKEDLPLAICAHATSKISTINDLFTTKTLGFRGEALASIASIAKVNFISRTTCQENAYEFSNIDMQDVQVVSRVVGTTIVVKDLFYNVPVRKKFLKSLKSEYLAIENVVKRFALSEKKIGITLKNDNKVILNLKKCITQKDFELRIQKIHGKTFIDNALYLKNICENIQIEGWVSNDKYQRSQNDKIFFYVNKRMIKNKLLVNALIKSYSDLLHPGKYPSCVLYLTLLPQEVDVNIHPQKHEVKFKDPRTVHDLITVTVKSALESFVALNKNNINIKNLTNTHLFNEDEISYAQSINQNDKAQKKLHIFDLENETQRSVDSFQYKVNAYIEPVKKKWTLLNKRFAIILLDTESYLIDIEKFMHFRFFKIYHNSHDALTSRFY